MARRGCGQEGGHGRMGGKGHRMEAATPESEARGIRVKVHDTPPAGSEVTTILPAFPSFFFNGPRALMLLNPTPRSLVEPLSIHPTNSTPPSI